MAADNAGAAVERLQAELHELRGRYAASQAEIAALRDENRALTDAHAEAREQQSATAEVLQIIASSPADPKKILDAVAAAAARCTRSEGAAIQQVDGDYLRWVGRYGRARLGADSAEASGLPGNVISVRTISGRALLERRTVYVPDVAAVIEREYPDSYPVYRVIQQRTQVTTPLLRFCRLMGGDPTVTSDYGQGSTFTVLLPTHA
jgi:hypothetical protein